MPQARTRRSRCACRQLRHGVADVARDRATGRRAHRRAARRRLARAGARSTSTARTTWRSQWRLRRSHLPEGYHRLMTALELHSGRLQAMRKRLLIVAPAHAATCRPRCAAMRRIWGVAVQLYALRSARNWGIGDFTDLAAVVELWGRRGAAIVGVNPLHALFPHNPAHASPYSPSSRRVPQRAVPRRRGDRPSSPTARDCRRWVAGDAVRARLRELRAAPLVDYAGVAALKRPAARACSIAHFRREHIGARQRRARAPFAPSCASAASALRRHALFEALQAHFHRADTGVWGWPVWPEDYRDPAAPAVQRFARAASRARRVLRVPAMAGDDQLGAVRTCARAGPGRRPLRAIWRCRSTAPAPRPGRMQAVLRARRQRRRAARRVQPERPGLGPAAARFRARSRASAYAPFIADAARRTCATPARCASTT